MARIDKQLHLVIPIYDEDGETIRAYVHATAISADIFDKYFLVISKTFAALHNEGLGNVAGPRVADKMLRLVSEQLKMWDGDGGVKKGLIAEIHRLAVVLAPGEDGWEATPFADAKKRKLIGEDDAAEVEGALVFFTCSSLMLVRTLRPVMLEGAASLWGAQISSLDSTAYLASLRTSTAAASTGAAAGA